MVRSRRKSSRDGHVCSRTAAGTNCWWMPPLQRPRRTRCEPQAPTDKLGQRWAERAVVLAHVPRTAARVSLVATSSRACYGAQAQGGTVPGADARGASAAGCPRCWGADGATSANSSPPPLRASAAQGWVRRWWSVLSVALQRAVATSALGVWTMPPPLLGAPDTLPLSDVLDLASASAPSRLPLC